MSKVTNRGHRPINHGEAMTQTADPSATQKRVDDIVMQAVANGTPAKAIIQALGHGGHFSLAAAVRRLNLTASKEGWKNGRYVAYDADTTFTRAG